MELNICFVVHRYPPFAGGSEYYVQAMAEECVKRGMTVTVLTERQSGVVNGVNLTYDPLELLDKDLVVVHCGGPTVQRYVLQNIDSINSPMLYMIIEPSYEDYCVNAAMNVDFLGCSTLEDWEYIRSIGQESKAHKVVHGISLESSVGKGRIFKEKFGIPTDTKMFLSCGGYWPNKQMIELAEVFNAVRPYNSVLVTTGYSREELMPPPSDIVYPLMLDDPADVKNAMADAYCYIMNSSYEGFGLTVLESMINKTPWIGRNIAGARLLSKFGTVYETREELANTIRTFRWDHKKINDGYEHVLANHLIGNTIDDIIDVWRYGYENSSHGVQRLD